MSYFVVTNLILLLLASLLITLASEGTLCFNNGVPCPVDMDEGSSDDNDDDKAKVHKFGYPKSDVYYCDDSESFGIRQAIDDHQTRKVIAASVTYMNQVVLANPDKYPVDIVSDKCRNKDEFCAYWAKTGQCKANPVYMKTHCAPVCQTCDPRSTVPVEGYAATTSSPTERSEAKNEMAFGVKQVVQDEPTRQIITAAIHYMNNVVWANPGKYSEEIRKNCRNHDEFCAYWAATGVCKENPSYMNVRCNPVCQSCDKLDYKVRCPIDPNAKNALNPGDLHRIFERIVSDTSIFEGLNVTILSRPYIKGHKGIYGLPLEDWQFDGPWVLSFETFLTDTESDRMIELGFQQGFERSANVGGFRFDGSIESVVNDERTSTNAWCTGKCNEDPIIREIWKKIGKITGIPETNAEHFHIARYEEGQYYDLHHDFIKEEVNRPAGPRILRFNIYLSDVEEGGETQFPNLDDDYDLTVPPKKGKALLWSCVKNENPAEADDRTQLLELPVEQGRKFSAIAWIHMRDFKTPNSKGCT
jgi:prolyl 4-hydroxylase